MENKLLSALAALAFLFLIIAVPVLIISTTATIYSHSVELYKSGFNKYQISKVTGISAAQLDKVARQMVDYFGGRSPTPQLTITKDGGQIQLYSQKELIHLEDVRTIIRLFGILEIASIAAFMLLAVFIYVRKGPGKLLRGIQIGAIITAAFTGVLVVWALIDFNSLFLLFHFISFSNNLWILDPTRDYLIMMFPEGFFNDAAILMVSTILMEAVVIWLAAFFIRKAVTPVPR
jgi:integral membrane protein (TIGR01906 family)